MQILNLFKKKIQNTFKPKKHYSTEVRIIQLMAKHERGLTANEIRYALDVPRQTTCRPLAAMASHGLFNTSHKVFDPIAKRKVTMYLPTTTLFKEAKRIEEAQEADKEVEGDQEA